MESGAPLIAAAPEDVLAPVSDATPEQIAPPVFEVAPDWMIEPEASLQPQRAATIDLSEAAAVADTSQSREAIQAAPWLLEEGAPMEQAPPAEPPPFDFDAPLDPIERFEADSAWQSREAVIEFQPLPADDIEWPETQPSERAFESGPAEATPLLGESEAFAPIATPDFATVPDDELVFAPEEAVAPVVEGSYLERARKAARENRSIAKEERTFFGLSRKSAISFGLTSGLSAALLVAGLMIGKGRPERVAQTSAGLGPVGAEAAEAPASQARLYVEAARLLEEGRTDRGAAMMRRAAEAGVPMAQYRLAKLYEHGEGVPRSLAIAREWTERAAQGGNCRAMHDIGVFYAQGDGARVDEAAALRWFHEAAAHGIADSQYNLGVLYEHGRGVDRNARESLFWFLVAARFGDVNAADRAVAVAAGLTLEDVEDVRVRARAFQRRQPDAAANAGGEPACAAI